MKILTAFLVALFFTGPVSAQIDTVETHGFNLFDQLDTSLITTGYLMNRAVGAGTQIYLSDGENVEAPVLDGHRVLDNMEYLRQAAVKPNNLM